jgi:hypothetical protein
MMLVFHAEDGGSPFLWNVETKHTAQRKTLKDNYRLKNNCCKTRNIRSEGALCLHHQDFSSEGWGSTGLYAIVSWHTITSHFIHD